MTQRCSRSVVRVLLFMAALATTAGATALSAQSTGKIEGYVRDPQGQPIANARVQIVGTAYSAPANAQGYWFIENVPPSTVAVRATFVGYQPKEKEGVRVLAGQTGKLEFVLDQAPVTLSEIVVREAVKNALVPRDQVTTKQTVTGDMTRQLPVDRIQAILALQPGVVQVSNAGTQTPLISVRGGRVDQNATFIDGVPVQNIVHTNVATASGGNQFPGAPQLTVAPNGFEEASITTGASSAAQGNAQGGIINISTKTGGSKFAGNLGYETGLLGGAYYGSGLNQFAGSISGPITKRLSFAVSGRLEAATSLNGGNHAWLFPTYSAVGIDTTYRVAAPGKAVASGTTDSVDVNVYNFAVTTGGCSAKMSDPSIASTAYQNSQFAPIASNYGTKCTANQAYSAPNTNYFTNGKLNYSFGQGSRVSLSYIYSGNQNRLGNFNNGFIRDGSVDGTVSGANLATLNWNQTLIRQATHQLTLDAYISRQWSNTITAPLTPASEQSSRSAPLGILTSKLKFRYNPKDYPVDSALIVNMLTNSKVRRIGITDPNNTTQYNGLSGFNISLPQDGVPYFAGGGGFDDNFLTYNVENRWVGIANLDFQADRYNRLKVGATTTSVHLTDFNANATGNNTMSGKPVQYAAYGEDRLDLGDVVLVGGLRYDYYWSKAWRWNEFPLISSRPGFSKDSLYCPTKNADGSRYLPSATAKCALVQDPSHNYLSPHVQVAFPVTDKTNFRLSYAQNVQSPDFGLIYRYSLYDLNVNGINQRGTWGGDLDFGKTITFEFGARHAFSDDMVLDVAVYNNDIVANPSFGFEHPIDPSSGQAAILYLVTNKDFGNTRGLDVRLDRRIGNYFNGSISYSYQDTRNTGSDPTSYLGFFEPLAASGAQAPTAALPTALSRPHSLTAVFNVSLPADWNKGNVLGTIFNRTGFFITARAASGAPYTRCDPLDASSRGVLAGTAPNGGFHNGTCGTLGAISGFNASRLPTQKAFDMRVTKDFRIGKYGFTGYLDGRNILNLKNITRVYAQTGTTVEAAQTEALWAADSVVFAQYATGVSQRQADGSIKLPTSIAGCGSVRNGVNSFAPECYYYVRSEQRFGNGDGLYTLAEQRKASDSKQAATNSIWNFVSGARVIRFGLEVNF